MSLCGDGGGWIIKIEKARSEDGISLKCIKPRRI